ncbi:hypothetical protein DFP72DRAFT_855327 [Ephemerocybe angulata]|uniref:Uncharacterized protein n=1 Tax=Ephemerocybe angulata TaxID=980116 RepID=A0A8H6HG59_9AGAR|nr:hypothetical protein DFP72DRAFT_855327 [Tulosesus angulatus]
MQLTSILSIFSIILAFAATQTIAENIMDLGDDDIHARALNLEERDLMEDEFGTLYRVTDECALPFLSASRLAVATGEAAFASHPQAERASTRVVKGHRASHVPVKWYNQLRRSMR